MEGVLLVGGMLADKACVPTPRPTLRSKSWHLSVGPGPPGWGFLSVWYPLLPVSPAARVHFNYLSVLRSLSQDMCTHIQTYLTLQLRYRLQKTYEMLRVGVVPLTCTQDALWPC